MYNQPPGNQQPKYGAQYGAQYGNQPRQGYYGNQPIGSPYGQGFYGYAPTGQNVRDLPPYRPGVEDSTDTPHDERFLRTFDNSVIRAKFIRKVYTILSIQLAFTTIFNIPFLYVDQVQEFVANYMYLSIGGLMLFIVPYFMLVCCESTRRTFPTNIILLCLMTLGLSIVCGFLTAKLSTEVVFYAFFTTVIVTTSITILSIFCPFDITSCGMVLCVLSMIVFIFGIIATIYTLVVGSKILNLVWSGLMVILFSLFLMFDTQAIMGGRRVSLTPEDYILGAIQLYVDIIEIFINFLMYDTQAIMGGRRISLSPEEYVLGAVQLYVDIIQIFLHLVQLMGACTSN